MILIVMTSKQYKIYIMISKHAQLIEYDFISYRQEFIRNCVALLLMIIAIAKLEIFQALVRCVAMINGILSAFIMIMEMS